MNNNIYVKICSLLVRTALEPTRRETDAVAIFQLERILPELAHALFHKGLLLAQLVDDYIKFPLQDVNFPFCKLLLPLPQQLLMVLLLDCCSC